MPTMAPLCVSTESVYSSVDFAARRVGRHPLRQSEVADERMARAVNQNVGRLEIAVQQPVAMGFGNRTAHGQEQSGRLARGERPLGNLAGESRPFDELHAEERLPFVVADFVHRGDVGMMQAGSRLGLGPKAGQVGSRRQRTPQDHLECDNPPQADLPRAEHHPHAAPTDLVEDLVIANALVRLKGRRGTAGGRRRRGRVEDSRHAGKVLGHHGRRPEHADFVDQIGMAAPQRLEIGRRPAASLSR